jgi:antitoxin ParD1/3/4
MRCGGEPACGAGSAVAHATAMPGRAKRTFSLPPKDANYIDALVASGACESPSDVIRAGLQALRDRDSTVERWLCDEVVPVYDAMQSDPSRALSALEVAAALRSHHADRVKRAKRGT